MPSEEEKSIFLKELENEQKSSAPDQNSLTENQTNPSDNSLSRNEILKQNNANLNQSEINQSNQINNNLSSQTSSLENNNNQNKKKKMSGIALFVAIFFLFLLTIALFIFIMSVGGSGNPILKTFGVPEDGAKKFLLKLVNGSFATFSTVLLLTFTISIFVGFATKKTEKLKRRASFIFSAVCGGLIFFVILVWLGMWNFVNAFVVETSSVKAEILLQSESGSLEEIQAPVDITLSAKNIRQAIEKKKIKLAGFRWDFGSGTFSELKLEDSIVHHFTTSGKFVIRLEAVAEDGQTQIFKKDLLISEALFEAYPLQGNAPLKVKFNGENITSNLNVDYFEWDFNDGTKEQSKEAEITHTFEKIGTYYVALRVVDSHRNVKNFKQTIKVTGESTEKLQAKIEVFPDKQGVAPFKVKFDASESFSTDGNITSFKWKFSDDGSTSSSKITEHTFMQSGSFEVKLKIQDESGAEKEKVINIKVHELQQKLQAQITTNPPLKEEKISGNTPLSVEFNAQQSKGEIINFKWDFDNDQEFDAFGEKVNFTFRQAGMFPVLLQVEDNKGETADTTIKVEVIHQDVVANFSTDPQSGSVPLTVKLDASSSKCEIKNCRLTSFQWDFGDGSEVQLAGAQIQHVFDQVGVFTVKLKVFTDTQKTAETSKEIFVRHVPLTACFNPSRNKGHVPLTVTFDPTCTTGPAEKFQWDFGDKITSSSRKVNHTFQEAGTFKVKLKIFDDKNNLAEISKEIVVLASDE